MFEPRVTSMKETWLAESDSKRESKYYKFKSKQVIGRTKIGENQMNRTLRDSREVLYLIDKMQGKPS